MPYADRDTTPDALGAQEPVEGLTGAASEIKVLLADLSTEIEQSRRRQGQALLEIERRLNAIDPSHKATAAQGSAPSDEPDNSEPWDAESAEALSDVYEAAYLGDEASETNTRSWLQSRFLEVSQHIAQTLSEMRPQARVHALEQKLEHFHAHVRDALEHVARRSDVTGLKLIESHVLDLGDKLADIQKQLQRLDGVEENLRRVMDGVTGEGVVRLSEHQDAVADVIDSTAARTAEELHQRMAEANAVQAIDAGRFDALRSMIEEALVQQRQTADALKAGAAEASQINDLKSLVESSMAERRRSEQDAMAMLDAVQQALGEVLGRIEELDMRKRAGLAAPPLPSAHSFSSEAAAQGASPDHDEPSWKAQVSAAQFAAREREPTDESQAHAEAAPARGYATTETAGPASTTSEVERMRREFIADAQRAKLRAAASLRDPGSDHLASRERRDRASTNPIALLRTKLFGTSPKLLAGALALIIIINGGLLLMSHRPSAPPIAVEILKERTSEAPATDNSHAATGAREASEPIIDEGQRSEAYERRDFAADHIGSEGGEAGLPHPNDAHAVTPEDEATVRIEQQEEAAPSSAVAGSSPLAAPTGLLIHTSPDPVSDATLAAVYQQQVLAGLSENLGAVAAQSSMQAMLPEKSRHTEAALTLEDAADEGQVENASTLNLPPATVGPLSLRLAAAEGDPSAQFEVAARLAEGKGTAQNLPEAVRWYQRSAAQGFVQAQYRIGTFYERGLGVPKDTARARVWYQRAAERGNVKAMHNLAVLTAGESSPDYRAASVWFKKAAEHGLTDSQYNLAVLYENGLGVPRDPVAAYKWYAIAARGGDKDAIERLEAVKATLSESDLKSAEALLSDFVPKAADPLANDARVAGEDWKRRINAEIGG